MKEMLNEEQFEYPSKPEGPILTDGWNDHWLPITNDDSSNFVSVDLSPPKDGVMGQIIYWSHERGATHVIANSFTDWLTGIAQDFEENKFDYDKKLNRIFPRRS